MRLLQNSNFVFMVSAILGLLFPQLSTVTKGFVILALAVVMCFSLINLDFSKISRKNLPDILTNFLINYVILTGLILILAFTLIDDEAIRLGFVVMAAVPPAIAIVPFTYLLKGNVEEALISNTSIYLISIFLMPALMALLTGNQTNQTELLKVLVTLILIPLAVSRFPRRFEIRHTREIINLGFSVVIYTVVGLNRNLLFQSDLIFLIALICFMRTFVSGTTILLLAKSRMEVESAIVKALFGSYKNLGLSATVALILFGEKASLPSAICILLEVSLFIYYSHIVRLIRSNPTN